MEQSHYRDAYNRGQEIVPDYVYDRMGLSEFDDSIGVGELADHKYPMLSLPTKFCNMENITAKDIYEYGLPKRKTYCLSAKADGVAVSLQSNGGKYRLVSRGRRTAGHVLHQALLKCVFLKRHLPDDIELRGELLLKKGDFTELNPLFENRYANSRSMVCAMANATIPDKRVVDKMFILWHGIHGISRTQYHPVALQQYVNINYIIPFEIVNKNELETAVQRLYETIQTLDYPCDGIVIEHSKEDSDDGRVHTGRIAFKSFDEAKHSGTTKVTNIEWMLCPNGHYIPRIYFAPVVINNQTISKAAGYCYDYLIRMGVSIGSEVVVTLHGGVIPYVSTVHTAGSGNLNLPGDIIPIEKGDIDIWSSNSKEAVKRLRFFRGMEKLNINLTMSDILFECGFEDIISLVSYCRSVSFEQAKLMDCIIEKGRISVTGSMSYQVAQLLERFKTLDYQSLIRALLIPGIGSKTANVIALKLSGFHVKADFEKGISKITQAKILDDEDLCAKIKANSQPISIENAEGTTEHDEYRLNKSCKKLH